MFRFAPGGIRHLHTDLYLTFDDGPDPETTPAVLDLLDQYDAKATFFVIVESAEASKSITKEILRRGHSIGNHSLNHSYRPFFWTPQTLRQHILTAEDRLTQLTGTASVGFRPPAGVVTPPLVSCLKEIMMPLYLWSHRFYDTQFPWTERRALNSISSLFPGAIVLLHDRQKAHFRPQFLQTLNTYLRQLSTLDFHMRNLAPAMGRGLNLETIHPNEEMPR